MDIFSLMDQIGTKDKAIQFLRDRKVLRSQPFKCTNCDKLMTENKRQCGDGFGWRCNRRLEDKSRCISKASIRKGSIFANSKLELRKCVLLAYLWAYEISITAQESMCGISLKIVMDWNLHFRKICTRQLLKSPIKLGGVDKIVEIDEFLLTKKRNKENFKENWILGMYDVEKKIGVLISIAESTQEVLFPLIKQFVLPGSIIHSDNAEIYVDGDKNKSYIINISVQPPYQHKWMNRDEHFVDPVTRIHTNNILCFWKNAKNKNGGINGRNAAMLSSYLDEFVWRQIYGKKPVDAFNNLLQQISSFYPIND